MNTSPESPDAHRIMSDDDIELELRTIPPDRRDRKPGWLAWGFVFVLAIVALAVAVNTQSKLDDVLHDLVVQRDLAARERDAAFRQRDIAVTKLAGLQMLMLEATEAIEQCAMDMQHRSPDSRPGLGPVPSTPPAPRQQHP